MSDAPAAALVAVASVAVLLAALLGAGEAAVLRLGRSHLAELGGSARPAARRVRDLARDPGTSASAAASLRVVLEALGAVAVTLAVVAGGLRWWHALLIALAVVAAAALVLVRMVPRTLARRHPLGTAMVTSPLLVVAHAVLAPSRLLGRAASEERELTDDEIREMVDRVSESEHIEDDEREMFRSVLGLGDTITRAVMVPRTEMVTLPSGTPERKALSLFLRSGFSRVPVVGESVDDLLGVLYLKDVVRHRFAAGGADDAPVDALVRPPVFVPESKPVDALLREMQQGAFHMALVVDEFGGIAGLVTMEDALEEIVGELTDEHDRAAPEVEELGRERFRVPARLPIDELGELFDLEVEDDEVDTAGGLLAKALGKVPLPGSSADVAGLRLTADRAEGRRRQLSTILVERSPEPDGVDDAPTAREGARR